MKKLFCLILTALIALTATACDLPSPKRLEELLDGPSLTVHFIDVGQGDCTLLESEGEFVLIDAGEKEYGDTVVEYLESRFVDRLAFVIATHPHADHIGGLAEVIDRIETQNFITVETDQSLQTWLKVLDAVDRHDVNYIDAVPGDSYEFGTARLTILAPLGSGYEGYNNYSVVTKVECGEVSFLLTGDAEKQSEYEMVKAGEDPSADVLKCGHHGSSTSSTARFLKAVRPAAAVISCGKYNDYGHPHKETLKKLSLMGTQVYRTDKLGTIIAHTDGETVRFYTEDEVLLGRLDPQQATVNDLICVGNKNSGIFHMQDCPGAQNMSEKNRVEFGTREDALAAGYKPCPSCKP